MLCCSKQAEERGEGEMTGAAQQLLTAGCFVYQIQIILCVQYTVQELYSLIYIPCYQVNITHVLQTTHQLEM